jgi:predicted  nucleic acid-binding Zn-ribbon protein
VEKHLLKFGEDLKTGRAEVTDRLFQENATSVASLQKCVSTMTGEAEQAKKVAVSMQKTIAGMNEKIQDHEHNLDQMRKQLEAGEVQLRQNDEKAMAGLVEAVQNVITGLIGAAVDEVDAKPEGPSKQQQQQQMAMMMMLLGD